MVGLGSSRQRRNRGFRQKAGARRGRIGGAESAIVTRFAIRASRDSRSRTLTLSVCVRSSRGSPRASQRSSGGGLSRPQRPRSRRERLAGRDGQYGRTHDCRGDARDAPRRDAGRGRRAEAGDDAASARRRGAPLPRADRPEMATRSIGKKGILVAVWACSLRLREELEKGEENVGCVEPAGRRRSIFSVVGGVRAADGGACGRARRLKRPCCAKRPRRSAASLRPRAARPWIPAGVNVKAGVPDTPVAAPKLSSGSGRRSRRRCGAARRSWKPGQRRSTIWRRAAILVFEASKAHPDYVNRPRRRLRRTRPCAARLRWPQVRGDYVRVRHHARILWSSVG